MSAEALYKEMGLRGYEVLRSWEEDGALCVEVAARRAALTCKTCGCRRVHVHERRERWWQTPPFVWTVAARRGINRIRLPPTGPTW